MTGEPAWLDLVAAAIGAVTDRDRLLLERRTFAHPGCTLQELAAEWNITRERVRQLETRLIRRCTAIDVRAIDRVLAELRRARTAPLTLRELPALDARARGVDAQPGRFAGLLRSFDARHRVPADRGQAAFVTLRECADLDALMTACSRVVTAPAIGAATVAAKEAAVAAHLQSLDAPELFPLVRERLLARGPGVLLPTIAQRIEQLLRDAGRPLAFAEIVRALAPTPARKVAAALEQAAIVRVARGVYRLPPDRDEWAHLLPAARDDVPAFLSCEPGLQWRADELLAALVDAGADWAAPLSAQAFECLLAEVPGVVNLRRGYWGLAAVHDVRMRVQDLAVRELESAGGPLHMRELLQRVRAQRSVGDQWRPRFPAALLGNGMVGLAHRDLGITAASFARWLASLSERLRERLPVDEPDIVAAWAATGGPAVPAPLLHSLLVGEQTLHRRILAQRAAPRPARRGSNVDDPPVRG